MSFPFLDFRFGQLPAVGDFVMAVVAENDEIIILVVGPVTVNVVFRKQSTPFVPQMAQESSVSR